MRVALYLKCAEKPAGAAAGAAIRRADETWRLTEKVRRLPEVRLEQVCEARILIARGMLETRGRIEETVRRLTEDLGL